MFSVWLTPAQAALVCYDLKSYPAVGALEKTEDGLRVIIVGGEYQEPLESDEEQATNPLTTRSPVMQFSEEEGWEQVGFSECGRFECMQESTQHCDYQTGELSEQGVTCATGPDKRYFGLSFYSGEGMDGTGGWGWFEEDGERHIERGGVLHDASINTMAHDGHQLWVGTTHNYECTGKPPAVGLRAMITNPPDSHVVVQPEVPYPRDETTDTCGFVFNDMIMVDGDLWVSSDMGVTRLAENPDLPVHREPTHYVPTGDPNEPMRETSCGNLYRTLLSELPHGDEVPPNRLFRPRETLLRNLMKFRQGFMIDYINDLQAGEQSEGKHSVQ